MIWNEYRELVGEGKNSSQKTDVVIRSDNIDYTISLKSGPARLTSAGAGEMNAILLSVLDTRDYPNSDKIRESIMSILSALINLGKCSINKLKDPYTYLKGNSQEGDCPTITLAREWTQRSFKVLAHCNKIWITLKNEYPEYIDDVYRECVSGEHKFGTNIGRANWLIELESSVSRNIRNSYDLRERSSELSEYLRHSAGNKPWRAKSSSPKNIDKTTIWLAFL